MNLIILLAGSILAIVIGAELFTNAVEWARRRRRCRLECLPDDDKP